MKIPANKLSLLSTLSSSSSLGLISFRSSANTLLIWTVICEMKVCLELVDQEIIAAVLNK